MTNDDRERLRCAALCLARLQRRLPEALPPPFVSRALALSAVNDQPPRVGLVRPPEWLKFTIHALLLAALMYFRALGLRWAWLAIYLAMASMLLLMALLLQEL
ncbi:hypothetical protein ABPG75_012315 [Micractinium tetrahymenae]